MVKSLRVETCAPAVGVITLSCGAAPVAPAQPPAVVSPNQPLTANEPAPGTVAPLAGTSTNPLYVLSATAPGPGSQLGDCAAAGAAETIISTAEPSATSPPNLRMSK